MAGFEIGLCWGTINKADLPETIEIAARFGFPTIQVTPDIFRDSLESGLTEKMLRKQLEDAGVRVSVIDCISAGIPGMCTDPILFRGRKMQRADAATCIRVAEALDAPVINISHYRGGVVPLQEMADAVGEVCRQAAPGGKSIVLEFVPDSGIRNLKEASAIVQACGESNCQVLLDTWHLARSGGTVADIQALPPNRIGAFQLSDRVEPPHDTAYVPMTGRLLPGEGELPLYDIVAAAVANNPAITLEVEVFSEELNHMPPADAAARVASALRVWRQR